MNLRGNSRMYRAWCRAMKYGPSCWAKYWYLCEEHAHRTDFWFDSMLRGIS